jgi:hypothetical protein
VRSTVLYGPRDIRFEERTAPTIMMPSSGSRLPTCAGAPVALQGHQPRRGAHFSSLPYGRRSAT